RWSWPAGCSPIPATVPSVSVSPGSGARADPLVRRTRPADQRPTGQGLVGPAGQQPSGPAGQRRGSMWIFGAGPAPVGRVPASTSATSSSPMVAATSGRGSTLPLVKAAIAPGRPGEADSTPTAV